MQRITLAKPGALRLVVANLIRRGPSCRICSSLSTLWRLSGIPYYRRQFLPRFRDRSCLSIFHYAAFSESIIYIREASGDVAIQFQYALWMHREFEEWYLDNTTEREYEGVFVPFPFAHVLIKVYIFKWERKVTSSFFFLLSKWRKQKFSRY